MNLENDYVKATKNRVGTVRLRTWTLTIAILISIAIYILVNVTTRQSINWVDFALLCTMQIIVHSLYFPDGDLFGQKDNAFISNKNAYNQKASDINENKEIANLRKYCDFEYEERKERYILNQCSIIGITLEELEILKQKPEKEILKIEKFETKEIIDGEEKGRLIFFSKHKRKILYNLIFKTIPVEKNSPETIMSAVENNGNKAIRDGSISYKAQSYIRKIFTAVIIGGFFAYIGYTLRDGFGFAQVVQICMYITTLFTTAVMAFTSGETCSKVHKSHFYLDLANFIDGFNEWNSKQPKITHKEND
jgi:hypothetical protein